MMTTIIMAKSMLSRLSKSTQGSKDCTTSRELTGLLRWVNIINDTWYLSVFVRQYYHAIAMIDDDGNAGEDGDDKPTGLLRWVNEHEK